MSNVKNNEISEEAKFRELAKKMQEAQYKGMSQEEIEEAKRQKEMKKKENIDILKDTLDILKKGFYIKDGKKIELDFSLEMMKGAQVYLPDDIKNLQFASEEIKSKNTKCEFNCKNIDALSLAFQRNKNVNKDEKILVLNFASATQPGGQTRNGASAQEEDLCRKTSLLLSLESEDAKKYYDFNNLRKTHMGSDGVVLSKNVEVIKDVNSELLYDPFEISVVSCAAPMIRLGLEGMSQKEYRNMLYERIKGILLIAALNNYQHLIFGAFGCGIFGNDAATVSDIFYDAICNFSYNQKDSGMLFKSIDFAILCKDNDDYNYKEFCRNFLPKK